MVNCEMLLIKQMILKKLEKHTKESMNDIENFWDFYHCLQLANAHLKLKNMPSMSSADMNLVSKYWKLLHSEKENNAKNILRMLCVKDSIHINSVLREFKDIKVSQQAPFTFFSNGIVAVASSYYDEEDD